MRRLVAALGNQPRSGGNGVSVSPSAGCARVSRPRTWLDRRSPPAAGQGDLRSALRRGQETRAEQRRVLARAIRRTTLRRYENSPAALLDNGCPAIRLVRSSEAYPKRPLERAASGPPLLLRSALARTSVPHFSGRPRRCHPAGAGSPLRNLAIEHKRNRISQYDSAAIFLPLCQWIRKMASHRCVLKQFLD